MKDIEHVNSVDIREIVGIILRRKWLVIIPVIIVAAVAYGSVHFLEPVYESSTIVWIDKPSSVSRELLSIVGQRPESRQEQESRILALQTEITSRNFLQQLIDELKLGDDVEINRLAARAREATPTYSLEQVKLNLLVERLRKQITVSVHGYDQIRITVRSSEPELAQDMADRLAAILEREKAKYEMEKILDNQVFTDMQLKKTEYYYEQVLDSLTAAQTRLSRLRLPDNVSSEANHAAIKSTIEKVKLDIADYTKESGVLRNQLGDFDLDGARLRYTDTIVELRTSIEGLVSTYGDLVEIHAWNEPNVIAVNIRLDNNIKQLEGAIDRAVREQYSSYPENQQQLLTRYFVVNENLDILNSKERRLQQPLDELEERTLMIPRIEAEIVELQTRVENARRYRDAFKSEETTAGILSEQAKDRTKYRIIEPAELPLAPVWPDHRKIIILGILLGLALGGTFVILTELFDNSFRKVEDVEIATGIPVLATIPKVEGLKAIR